MNTTTGQDDVARFIAVVGAILDGMEGLPSEGLEWDVATFEVRGLVGLVEGERKWWPYAVDRDRLRKEGSATIARHFLQQYVIRRNMEASAL